ncbi:MAG TPA: DedA family protein [Micromonosporaceae bacterium]|nr:DedA family protein [Micromonosporaceae bacterium]
MELVSLVATPLLAYLLVAGMVALDAVFPALPSDVAVVSAGAFAATGHLELGWAVAAIVAGAMAGDHIVYQVGRRGLPGVLDRTRLGRRLHDTVDRSIGGSPSSVSFATLAMGRFIPFGRTASAASAGLADVPLQRYAFISLVGAASWAAWMVGLGYVTGDATTGPVWLQVAVATAVGVTAAVLIAAAGQLIARRRRPSAPVSRPSCRRR